MGSACKDVAKKLRVCLTKFCLFKKHIDIPSNENVVPLSGRNSLEVWTRGGGGGWHTKGGSK